MNIDTEFENATSKESKELQPLPTAPKTAFMCFSEAKESEFEGNMVAHAEHERIQIIADLWRRLSRSEKAYWDEVAREDKVRYMKEKAEYKGPYVVPKRRAKKHPLAPKRPMSAFLKYSQAKRKQVRDSNRDMSNTDISRLLGEMWRNATEEEKKPFTDQELRERLIYRAEIAKWRSIKQEEETNNSLKAVDLHASVASIENKIMETHQNMTPSYATPYGREYNTYQDERHHEEYLHESSSFSHVTRPNEYIANSMNKSGVESSYYYPNKDVAPVDLHAPKYRKYPSTRMNDTYGQQWSHFDDIPLQENQYDNHDESHSGIYGSKPMHTHYYEMENRYHGSHNTPTERYEGNFYDGSRQALHDVTSKHQAANNYNPSQTDRNRKTPSQYYNHSGDAYHHAV